MLALGLQRPDLQRVAIEAQAEDAVRVEAGDVGLGHLLGGDLGVRSGTPQATRASCENASSAATG